VVAADQSESVPEVEAVSDATISGAEQRCRTGCEPAAQAPTETPPQLLPIDLAERSIDAYAIPEPQNENVKKIMKHFFRELAAIGNGTA
jgi:hypothetical protein